jgi:hypothetical protein
MRRSETRRHHVSPSTQTQHRYTHITTGVHHEPFVANYQIDFAAVSAARKAGHQNHHDDDDDDEDEDDGDAAADNDNDDEIEAFVVRYHRRNTNQFPRTLLHTHTYTHTHIHTHTHTHTYTHTHIHTLYNFTKPFVANYQSTRIQFGAVATSARKVCHLNCLNKAQHITKRA